MNSLRKLGFLSQNQNLIRLLVVLIIILYIILLIFGFDSIAWIYIEISKRGDWVSPLMGLLGVVAGAAITTVCVIGFRAFMKEEKLNELVMD